MTIMSTCPSIKIGEPIILVPRRIVRTLPWINFADFERTELRAYLAAKVSRSTARRATTSNASGFLTKDVAVGITHKDLAIVDKYVAAKESGAVQAQPTELHYDAEIHATGDDLTARLECISVGRDDAALYQRWVLETLNYLFVPELADGRMEERTADGTERRDIVFTNESDESFWEYVRSHHDGIFVMFEVKNTKEVSMTALNQTATYLGSRLGTLGFIVTRKPPSPEALRKAFSIWNDSPSPKKAILILDDGSMQQLIAARMRGSSTTRWMQAKYREFRTRVQ